MRRLRLRSPAPVPPASAPQPVVGRPEHERRFLRFNDQFRTMTVPLRAESYAEAQDLPRGPGSRVPPMGRPRGIRGSVTPSSS